MLNLPRVAIIGRPNVGKSTLFNQLIGGRIAITEASQGVTRDRICKINEWEGVKFVLIDTGGIITCGNIEELFKKIREQSIKAVKESELVILVTDIKEGLHPLDEEIAQILRKENKKAIVAVNKVDNERLESEIVEFQKLGIEDIIAISAAQGLGRELLLDKIKENINFTPALQSERNYIKISLIGRPNVGKSSFLNALLNEERVVVDEKPGTTRDAIDTYFSFGGESFLLIDTAGIRKRKKIKDALGYFSSLRTKQAIARADVVLFIIDGWEGITGDDLHYIYSIWEEGKGLVLVINKKDLIQKSLLEYEKLLRRKLVLSRYLPWVYISAKKREHVEEAIWAALSVYKNLGQRIKTSELNKLLREEKFPYPLRGKKRLKLFYASQIDTYPPKISIVVNYPQLVNKNFKNSLERKVRSKFGFMGVPIRLIFKSRRD